MRSLSVLYEAMSWFVTGIGSYFVLTKGFTFVNTLILLVGMAGIIAQVSYRRTKRV